MEVVPVSRLLAAIIYSINNVKTIHMSDLYIAMRMVSPKWDEALHREVVTQLVELEFITMDNDYMLSCTQKSKELIAADMLAMASAPQKPVSC